MPINSNGQAHAGTKTGVELLRNRRSLAFLGLAFAFGMGLILGWMMGNRFSEDDRLLLRQIAHRQ